MKYILFTICIIFSLNGISQIYHKSFSDTTLWTMKSFYVWTEGPGGPIHEEDFYSHKIVLNDTIIQDTLYQLLYSCNSEFSESSFSFVGYLKNINNQIFFGNNIDSMKIFYDYNLEIGDSFAFKCSGFFNDTIYFPKVTNIDSTLINNQYRKRIYFEAFNENNENCDETHISPCWVEGIGDYNYGLVFDYATIMNVACFGGDSFIECFSENNENIIGNCQITSNIDSIKINTISIYPNPSKDFINIKTNSKIENFELFNISGEKEIILQENKKIIDVSFLKPGIYFYKIKTEKNEILTGKLLIIR